MGLIGSSIGSIDFVGCIGLMKFCGEGDVMAFCSGGESDWMELIIGRVINWVNWVNWLGWVH